MAESYESRKDEFITRFRSFFQKCCQKDITKAAEKGVALNIDFSNLDKFNPEIGDGLLQSPETIIDFAKEALREEKPDFKINPRFFNVPNSVMIRNIRTKHIGRFISIEGIVKKASEVRPEIMQGIWQCKECGNTFSQPRKGAFLNSPTRCPFPNCKSESLTQMVDSEKVDTRWLTIEEPFELTEGDKPSQVLVYLTEDLISPDNRKLSDVGNRIKITGMLREIPKGKTVKLDFYLDVNHIEPIEIGWERIEISKADEERIKELSQNENIYEIFIDSMAPSIYGLREIKESIILQIFGGVQRTLKDKVKFRGDVHILLIGDASMGKSQLLKLIPEIVPRGRYVSGKGSTSAGLTASVTKDEMFGWTLEAGAIVLANKGVLAVDEFEKMAIEDQVAFHEALEQGSISIAKASITTTLPARTSVLAGANPKLGRFDPYQSIAKQITIPDTLLSRFDLKFALMDKPDCECDKKTCEHILKSRNGDEDILPKLSPEFIRKYISYAKDKCKPEVMEEASKMLKDFYIEIRKRAVGTKAVPITLRQFEAMLRLAEASAKVQLSDVVRISDAERAIKLMTFSMKQLGIDPETQEFDADKLEGGVPASYRGKVRLFTDLVRAMARDNKEVKIKELREEAREKLGIMEIDDFLEELLRNGEFFKPNPGSITRV